MKVAFYRQKEGLGAFKVHPVRIEPKPEGEVPDTTILGKRVGIFHPALSPSCAAEVVPSFPGAQPGTQFVYAMCAVAWTRAGFWITLGPCK